MLAIAAITTATQAKGFSELIGSRAKQNAQSCMPRDKTAIEPLVLQEIFPKVIDRTPGHDAGSAQLFEPIRKIAEPLAFLGSKCLVDGKTSGAKEGAKESCMAFSRWVDDLAQQDALYFDREKHRKSSVSFVTGALSGNLTIRPIALYVGVLRDAGLIHLRDNLAVDNWMQRRVADYDNLPPRLTAAAAQNLVLNSVLAKLTVGIAVDKPQAALSQSEQVFKLYLDTARADGSFPAETRRGISALKYSNMAIGELVMLAELATIEGVNLYDYRSPKGVTLHQAIGFVAKAMLDESLIADYAKENYAPTDKGDGTAQARQFVREHMGWVQTYTRRFPQHPNTKLLEKIMQSSHVRTGGYYDETLGAIAGCVW